MDHRPWPASQFREVARHLGIFNGDYLAVGHCRPTHGSAETGCGAGLSWPSR